MELRIYGNTDPRGLQPVGDARLYGEGAEDRGDDCCDEFKDLRNLGPVYFNHNEHKIYGLNRVTELRRDGGNEHG